MVKLVEEIKSFKDLIKEVQDPGICGKCGGCVSFCSAGELNALGLDKDGTPILIDDDKCLKCGICYLICPQIKALNPELKQKFGWRPPIGPYRHISSARSTDRKIRIVATDGGVVTALLSYALKKNIVQAAVVLKKIGPFARQPVMVTEPSELLDAAGSHYEESLHLDEIGRRYTTFAPTVREVKHIKERNLERIAIVGTPCQIYTIRKMQVLSIVPADAVSLTIGLFCMENFAFDRKAKRTLEKRLKLKLRNIEKINIKDDVILQTEDGKTVHLPFRAVDEIARSACFACPDFANDYADISCGGLGSPDGYTTSVIRTAIGEKIFNGAKQAHAIEELSYRNREEMRIRKSKMMAKIVSFVNRKKERAKKRKVHGR